jgi:hypothetical protein
MQGSIINRLCEKGINVEKPIVGQYATSYSYTDRDVHYIAKVEEDGKVFWTKNVGRCVMRPEFTATFRTDNKQRTRITIIGHGSDFSGLNGIRIEDKIFIPVQPEKDFWLFLYDDVEDEYDNRWQLLRDGRYHMSRYIMESKTNRNYSNSIKNMVITPNYYNYYYDPSF